jgi:hypothetical protein
MSLIGQSTALISLGCSCQTAQQLRVNAGALSAILGEDFAHIRLPFDWIVSSPGSTTRWLRDGLPFPAAPGELETLPHRPQSFLWRQRNISFWHDFQGPAGTDLRAAFAATAAQYAWSAAKLRALAGMRRVILVVANTQNNLAGILPAADPFENYVYTAANLVALKQAADIFLGRACDMLCVTHSGGAAAGLRGMPAHHISLARLPQDASAWEGHAPAWRDLLQMYLAPVRIAA